MLVLHDTFGKLRFHLLLSKRDPADHEAEYVIM